MKLIVGLGNPGKQYQATRHNIGWQVIAELANRHGVARAKAKFNGEIV
ncbi:MAG: aminoacyl-tRNA hydrolase, partial [Planctomycetaceae bacterium]|nr:aminoacyl-tRNA hydrolase [Planctomycetaceae bacterium]